MQPAWSMAASGGVDSGGGSAFAAGLGIALFAMALLFALLIGIAVVKSVLRAAGF